MVKKFGKRVIMMRRIHSSTWIVIMATHAAGIPSIAFHMTASLRPYSSRSQQICDRSVDIFGPKANHPTTFEDDPAFCFKVLNDDVLREKLQVASRTRLGEAHLSFFEELTANEQQNLVTPAKLGRSLSLRGCIDAKEYFESLEFYLRVRRRVRRSIVVDLACGHGLCGLFFAALEKTVKAVILVDSRKPQSFNPVFEAFVEVAPWVADKVHFREKNLYDSESSCRVNADGLTKCDEVAETDSRLRSHLKGELDGPKRGGDEGLWQNFLELPEHLLTEECGFVAVHACGRVTDGCLSIAAALRGPIAAMPCCYTGCGLSSPYGVRRMLGKQLASDIDRAYVMERAGYSVDFAAIPRCITPMNRILVAVPRGR